MRWCARAGSATVRGVATAVAAVLVVAGGAAAASGGLTVPGVTLAVTTGPATVTQKVTTSARGYNPVIGMASAVGRWVDHVAITSSGSANAAVCAEVSADTQWRCDGNLEPDGKVAIVYRPTAAAGSSVVTGSWAVTVTMGDGNGGTLSGSGTVKVSIAADLTFGNARLWATDGPDGLEGVLTVPPRNNGPGRSNATVVVSGLGSVPVASNGHACTRSGSTMTCTFPEFAPGQGSPFQLTLSGAEWTSLRITAKISGPYSDPYPGNNTVTVGPYDSGATTANPGGSSSVTGSGGTGAAAGARHPAAGLPRAGAAPDAGSDATTVTGPAGEPAAAVDPPAHATERSPLPRGTWLAVVGAVLLALAAGAAAVTLRASLRRRGTPAGDAAARGTVAEGGHTGEQVTT